MLFSSITFLYYFLPIVLILYFISPKALKNTVLLIASLTFYAWGEPKYVILMAVTILCGYVCGLLIEKFRGKTGAKIALGASAVISLGFLAYFKYADFFIENFNAATGLSVPMLRLALPIGISFYTFQILSYTIDVYRGDVAAQRNIISLAAYVSLFPQLIAGPIVRYSDVAQQLSVRTHSVSGAALGIRRFLLGLAKKIFIANALGELCAEFHATEDNSVLFCWLYGIAYSLQIYFDFSGYSDMAIGLGKLFGFDFMENFNYPYISKSVTEFWRRWHISLGSWFRDYVYIPLGGNRGSKLKWLRNILIVWLLTGFWHGAAWNFIVWGLFFAVFLVAEKLFLLKYLQKSKVLSHIYVLLLAIVSFVIFGAADMGQAWQELLGMAGLRGLPLVSAEALYYLRSYAFILILGCVGATPLPKKLASLAQEKAGTVMAIAEPVVLAAFLLTATSYLVNGSFNPFLYFRF
ncbi:MAG: MBOAT family protein [Oscillospiraceae bacterium]|nr:MBOAT family protein [Oscillospiraceae bacterium]